MTKSKSLTKVQPTPNKLTHNSEEAEIAALLSGDNIFAVPYFQRAYKWKPQRLKQLEEDILSLVDGMTDMHFLGAIIIHGRSSNPADPKVFDVIDGQQRIITLFLYIAAAVKTLCGIGDYVHASGLFLRYLAIGRKTTQPSNLKLFPSKEDRAQFNAVINDLLSDDVFKAELSGFVPKFLPSTGKSSGTLMRNYRAALKFYRSELSQADSSRVTNVYTAILESMSVVQIDVWDPTNGPMIFDSLNSRQEPMTIGDLVRNEVFAKVADEDPAIVEQLDQNNWQPFYTRFQSNGTNLFDSYFFPYGLTQNPNLSKSQVYDFLRKQWREIEDPKTIIQELGRYQDAFLDIACGTNQAGHPKKTEQGFKNLWLMKSPSSTYPFLMQLSQALASDAISQENGQEILAIIESFLVRRAICGHEPTGLHAVFKRLWTDCEGAPTPGKVTEEIKKHRTVVWPDGKAVKEAISARPLYGANITHYVLLQYDLSLKGDQPKDIPWIEHVLPEKPDKAWFSEFTKKQHAAKKDLIGNLIPLSEKMNVSLSNKPYEAKRKKYSDDAMFKSARKLAKDNTAWTPASIDKRGRSIALWAVKRWPH